VARTPLLGYIFSSPRRARRTGRTRSCTGSADPDRRRPLIEDPGKAFASAGLKEEERDPVRRRDCDTFHIVMPEKPGAAPRVSDPTMRGEILPFPATRNPPPRSPVEGNMCGVVMRGAVALPGSEATSRTKGSRRNLGGLIWPAVAVTITGRGRKARSRSCRGTGEESDEPRSPGEAPEQGRDERRRRAWREGGSVGGMADDWRCSGRRTGQSMPCPSPASGSTMRGGFRVHPITPDLRQEPGAGKPHAGICAGGRE
jgi:hypothetical protein